MNNFSHIILKYIPVNDTQNIAILSLNRPDKSNAINMPMVLEILAALEHIGSNKSCRCLVLTAKGDNFCAGADINWLSENTASHYEKCLEHAELLAKMYSMIFNLQIPTIAVAKGKIYGGGVGLIACTDYCICEENAKFCLSETKLGLIPAVILPYLSQKIPEPSLKRLVYGAQIFDAIKAKECGLCELIVPKDKIAEVIKNEINNIIQSCGLAQKDFKNLYHHLKTCHAINKNELTAQALATKLMCKSAEQRLKAFVNKDHMFFENLQLDNEWTIENEF